MPYEGVAELLSGLAKRTIKLAILSNKPHAMTMLLVKHFFLKPASIQLMAPATASPESRIP